MKTLCTLFATALLLVPALLAAAEPLDIGSRLELFVDDYLLDDISGGAKLQLQHPKPQEVSLVTNKPWEGNTSAYYTVFRDGDIYRMYYRGSHWDTEAKRATHSETSNRL